MMNSLELRSPFLDIELVDFIRKIPFHYKYRLGQTKYLLKKAVEPILPKEIIYQKKQGFAAPVGKWFQNGTLALSNNTNLNFLNRSLIERKITEHKKNSSDNRLFLWNQFILEKFQSKIYSNHKLHVNRNRMGDASQVPFSTRPFNPARQKGGARQDPLGIT